NQKLAAIVNTALSTNDAAPLPLPPVTFPVPTKTGAPPQPPPPAPPPPPRNVPPPPPRNGPRPIPTQTGAPPQPPPPSPNVAPPTPRNVPPPTPRNVPRHIPTKTGAPPQPPPPPPPRPPPQPRYVPPRNGPPLPRRVDRVVVCVCRPRKPRLQLKPFYWNNWHGITTATERSLWAEALRSEEPQSESAFDVAELARLFPKPLVKLEDKSDTPKPDNMDSTSPCFIFHPQRSRNIEIMLKKIKMPLSDVVAATLAMENSVLDGDHIEILIKYCPTKEEILQLEVGLSDSFQDYDCDEKVLETCDQLYLELMKVPRLKTKLSVFSFKIKFNDQVSDLRKKLGIVNSAYEEVRYSLELKEIMIQVLYLGNELNEGTRWGNFFPFSMYAGSSVGYELESLLKLSDTYADTTTSKMSLMHYLCKVIAAKYPKLLNFDSAHPSLEAASKIELKSLAEDLRDITNDLNEAKNELVASAKDGPVSEVFLKALAEFIGYAESEVALLSSYSSIVVYLFKRCH
ncbi:hypothetical protein MKX03_034979, partial [Papaver bracteatum]